MQLATELDMQVRQYQRFEYGEESFSSVNIKTGLKICRILQLDPFDLVLGDSCGTKMIPQTKNKPPGKKKRNHDSWNGRGSYPDPTANEAIYNVSSTNCNNRAEVQELPHLLATFIFCLGSSCTAFT